VVAEQLVEEQEKGQGQGQDMVEHMVVEQDMVEDMVEEQDMVEELEQAQVLEWALVELVPLVIVGKVASLVRQLLPMNVTYP
jgi:hypothetical protein